MVDATRPDIVATLLIMKLLNALPTITSIVSDKKENIFNDNNENKQLISPHIGDPVDE